MKCDKNLCDMTS